MGDIIERKREKICRHLVFILSRCLSKQKGNPSSVDFAKDVNSDVKILVTSSQFTSVSGVPDAVDVNKCLSNSESC